MKLQLLFLGMCTAKWFGSWVHKNPFPQSHTTWQTSSNGRARPRLPYFTFVSFPLKWFGIACLASTRTYCLTAYNITECVIQGVNSTLFSYLKQIKLAQTVNVVESKEIERNDRQEVRSVDSAPNLRFYSWTKVSVFLVCNLVTRRPC